MVDGLLVDEEALVGRIADLAVVATYEAFLAFLLSSSLGADFGHNSCEADPGPSFPAVVTTK